MRSSIVAVLLSFFLIACQEETQQEIAGESISQPEGSSQPLINCPDNRPDVCTQIYQPVCGLVDTGIRCITTPCPSAEYQTFGNACTACSDSNVTGYIEGECFTEKTEEEENTEQD